MANEKLAEILIIERNDRLNPILYYELDGIFLMDFDNEIRKFARAITTVHLNGFRSGRKKP